MECLIIIIVPFIQLIMISLFMVMEYVLFLECLLFILLRWILRVFILNIGIEILENLDKLLLSYRLGLNMI